MDTQHINGTHSLPPSGPDEILYHHAESLGEIKAELRFIRGTLSRHSRDIRDLKTRSVLGLTPLHYIQIGIGITVLGAAVTGRMSWGESLPIVGRMFGGL